MKGGCLKDLDGLSEPKQNQSILQLIGLASKHRFCCPKEHIQSRLGSTKVLPHLCVVVGNLYLKIR